MVKIENNNVYNIGDTVWWIDSWGTMRWGVVINVTETYLQTYLEGKNGSIMGWKKEECWPTKEELLKAEKRRAMLQKKEYMDSIRSVEDLVCFLYSHDMVSENKDYDAEAAAIEKAKELLGIDIEKDNKYNVY